MAEISRLSLNGKIIDIKDKSARWGNTVLAYFGLNNLIETEDFWINGGWNVLFAEHYNWDSFIIIKTNNGEEPYNILGPVEIRDDEKGEYVYCIDGTKLYQEDFQNTILVKSDKLLISELREQINNVETSVSALSTQLASINSFSYTVVSELPTASAETLGKIYLVKTRNESSTEDENDDFNEYITLDLGSGMYSWELIGNTRINLSDYVTKDELSTALESAGKIKGISVSYDGEEYLPVDIDENSSAKIDLSSLADKNDVLGKIESLITLDESSETLIFTTVEKQEEENSKEGL